MACCQRQAPPPSESNLPKGTQRSQDEAVAKSLPVASYIGGQSDGGSTFGAIHAELKSRLAPATLRAQHICLQV